MTVDLQQAYAKNRIGWYHFLLGCLYLPEFRFTTSWQYGKDSFLVRWDTTKPTWIMKDLKHRQIPWTSANQNTESFSQLGLWQASLLLMGYGADAEELAELAALGLAASWDTYAENLTAVTTVFTQLQRLISQRIALEKQQPSS